MSEIKTAGIGVDIVEIARMSKILERTPTFANRNFSDQEQDYCNEKLNPAAYYAGFFAAKEAVLKAIGTGFHGMKATDVEVSHDKSGKPIVILHGNASVVAEEKRVTDIYLSISRTHDVSVASAVISTNDTRPVVKEEPDSKEKLFKKYKELKSMLDEMNDELKTLEGIEGSEKPDDPENSEGIEGS